MDVDEVSSALCKFVRQQFGIPENDPDFNNEVDLFNYGYIDSFGAMELTSFIENQFCIRLTESDWVTFPLNTIQEIASFVSKRQEEKV